MKARAPQQVVASKLEDYLGYHLRRASIRDLNGIAATFGDGMRPVPFTVLCLIDEAPGITASEIARALRLQRANVAPMLAEFDGRGLIERRPDQDDNRIQRLHLSPAGADALAGWRAKVDEHEARTFGALTAAERQTLRLLLAKVWKDE